MSQLWKFSASSEPYLQRCIEAALLQETDNKWTQKFGRKTLKKLEKPKFSEDNTPIEIIDDNNPVEEEAKSDTPASYDEFFECIENEIRLDLVVEEYSKNPNIVSKMAERLSSSTVEKLFDLFLSSEKVNTNFLRVIILNFLPTYVKHENKINYDKLIKISQIHPEIFGELLILLFRDIDIPNELLNSYISTLDSKKCTIFLESLTNLDITSQEFVHKLSTIELAYAGCVKTEKIQDFIKTSLLKHSSSCTTDRNYGKLFMMYLQSENSLGHTVNVKQIEECLENHRSPFKRPCVTLLKGFMNE